MSVPIRDFRHNLSQCVNNVHYTGNRSIISKNGKDFVAIISLEDLQILEALEDAQDNMMAEDAMKEAQDKGFVKWGTLKKDLLA